MSSNQTESLAIANRYATAMFELAVDAKKEAVLVQQIRALAVAVEANEELADMLANPLISRSVKSDVLSAITTKAKGDALTQHSVETLADQGRAELLPQLATLLEEKLAAHRDLIVAEVTSARPLSAAIKKQITEALRDATGKDVQLTLREDPAVLGGVAIRMGSYLLDATLAGALSSIKTQLLAS